LREVSDEKTIMLLVHRCIFLAMWVGYFAYWQVVSKNVKATERREPRASGLARLTLIIVSILLWLGWVPVPLLNRRFLPESEWSFWAGAAITAGGLLFSVWARRHLGTNWSRAVTVKKDHELITSGPYALVRHPIYTGLLTAIVGCALALGAWRAIVGLVLIFVALWRKLSLEERWMHEQFGETYEAYARRVKALVPFVL
jgi:protein-S-isoprenylcysteine O-methyltransferase Ste14